MYECNSVCMFPAKLHMSTLMCNTLLDVIAYRKCSLFMFLLYVVCLFVELVVFCANCAFFSVIFILLNSLVQCYGYCRAICVFCGRSQWCSGVTNYFMLLSLAFGERKRIILYSTQSMCGLRICGCTLNHWLNDCMIGGFCCIQCFRVYLFPLWLVSRRHLSIVCYLCFICGDN